MVEGYEKPGKLNAVSIFIVLIILAAGYSLVQFGPPYYRKWKVKGVLSEAANKVYPRRFVTGETESIMLEEIRTWTYKEMRRVGVKDPGLQVDVNKNADVIGAGADYRERINHPVVKKTTTLHFRPYNTIKIQN